MKKALYARNLILVTLILVRIFGFWVITRSPLPWILLKIGGNSSYRPPGAVYTKIFENAPRENQNLEVKIFELTRWNLTTISMWAYLSVWTPANVLIIVSHQHIPDWFICYFRVLGKSFRGDFWRVLTCFPGSFQSIFRSKFPEKIAEHPFKTFSKPFKGP